MRGPAGTLPGQPRAEAAQAVVRGTPAELGGTGGLIAVDPEDRVTRPMSSEGRYRAMVDGQGRRRLALYADEPD